MIIILRGHIRNSFNNKNLLELVKRIIAIGANKEENLIYIHTWSIKSSSVSWRKVKQDDAPVSQEIIMKYFADLSGAYIRKILIHDDNAATFIGRTEGLCGLAPLLGWKRMWFGKYAIAKSIADEFKNEQYRIVLNMRFDVLANSNTVDAETVLRFVSSTLVKTRPHKRFDIAFIHGIPKPGIDNIYMGNVRSVFRLAESFHYKLDIIMKKFTNITHQEFFVFHEARSLIY